MRNQSRNIQLLRLHHLQQHRGGLGINQTSRNSYRTTITLTHTHDPPIYPSPRQGLTDIMPPQLLQMQIDLGPMHAHIRNRPARRHQILTELKRRRHADRLNDGIAALALSKALDDLLGILLARIDRPMRAHLPRHPQPAPVPIDHNQQTGRIQLRRHQGRQAHRPRPHNHHAAPRLHLPIQHPALQPRRQDIAQHDQRALGRPRRYVVQTGGRVRDAHVLGLAPVDRVSEHPAAGRAVRTHAAAAVDAGGADGDAGDEDAVAGLEAADAGAEVLDDADAFVAEDGAGDAGGDVAFEDVHVGAADGCFFDLDDRVGGVFEGGARALFQSYLANAFVDECFHGGCGCGGYCDGRWR